MKTVNYCINHKSNLENGNIYFESKSSKWESRMVCEVGTLPQKLFYLGIALMATFVVLGIVAALCQSGYMAEIASITGLTGLGFVCISVVLESYIND